MDKYNVLAGLCDNQQGHIIAYKEEVIDNEYGIYYKVDDIEDFIEESKETIGNLNQELLAYREQNDRLQHRCEELEKENERLKGQLKAKGLTVNLTIDDIDYLKQYLDYLKGEIEVALNHQVQGIKIKLMNYDEFKQKSR